MEAEPAPERVGPGSRTIHRQENEPNPGELAACFLLRLAGEIGFAVCWRSAHAPPLPFLPVLAGLLSAAAVAPPGRAAVTTSNAPLATLSAAQGTVDYDRAARTNWVPASIGQGLELYDRLRTGERSRAAIQWQDLSVLRLSASSILDILPPRQSDARSRLSARLGLFYFLHRNRPREIEVQTPAATAAIKGTEFHLAVEPGGRTVITLIDGEVGLTNEFAGIALKNGEQGTVDPGQPPRKTAVLQTANIIQWCLYYPAVLDPDELGLNANERAELTNSLAAYRAGDLTAALDRYLAVRGARAPSQSSEAERVYQAGLWLAVGGVTNAEALLSLSARPSPNAVALRWLIAGVRLEPEPLLPEPATASQWLGRSWFLQSRFHLEASREAARAAVRLSTNFAFGWARLAEIEYSFGRLRKAEAALARTLALAPRHAQAQALRGFVRLGHDDGKGALQSFEQAMALDSSLGNAWLGRGLCRMREGRTVEGRADLQTAAALEPNRWVLRSYLGKAYGQEAEEAAGRAARQELIRRAEAELDLAKAEDPADPTPWLYSALFHHQRNQTAAAIRDLETAVERNDNQRVYRSRFLLDQDLAVRNANLANIYDSAYFSELSVRESTRAVTYDYGNFSAHRNLASSFNALRDPTRFSLRAESDWFHEVLLANLLAPPGGVLLSQNLPQQEYYRPFARDRLGLSTTTELFSDGELRQLATHFGTFDGASYALDLQYQNKNGNRPNNDLERIEWYTQIKQKITETDSVFLLTKYQDYDAGDNFQYYDPTNASRDFRFRETQTPLVLAGLHHEWAPGAHTLFLGGRLVNDQRFRDTGVNGLALRRDPLTDQVVDFRTLGLDASGSNDIGGFEWGYHGSFETYSAELNQILEHRPFTDVFGARYQEGTFAARDRLTLRALGTNANPQYYNLTNLFADPPAAARIEEPFERVSLYAYRTWEPAEDLLLTGGAAYDHLRYPSNFRQSPISPGVSEQEHFSPKGALYWTPRRAVTFRAAYLQSVGGVSYDESARLEPTQLAGFRQSFRSAIPETIVGSVSAPVYETFGAAVDLQPAPGTYLSLQGDLVRSELSRSIGAFWYTNLFYPPPPIVPHPTRESLDFEERTLRLALDQILGQGFFFSAQYRFSRSELDQRLPDIHPPGGPVPGGISGADLHEVRLAGTYKHPSGLFARLESWWLQQENHGTKRNLAGDNFWQFNAYLGYEFPWKQGEFTIGMLNLSDQDYRLYPLSSYTELPRERLFYARVRLNF